MDCATQPTLPASRRPAALAACAVLAAIVNAAAIGVAADASHVKASATFGSPGLPVAMEIVAAAQEPGAPMAAQIEGTPPVAATIPITHRAAPRAHARVVAHTVPPTASAVDATAPPTVFYGYREVDDPAFPVNDWNIDIDTLDRAGVQRLAFEVLIGDRGEIVGCSILDPAGLPDDVKQELELRLAQTELLPAQRAGQAVASKRRIELSVVSTPVDLAAAPVAARQP